MQGTISNSMLAKPVHALIQLLLTEFEYIVVTGTTMPTQVDPPYSEDPVSRLNIVPRIENFFLYEREFRSTEYKSKYKTELWHEFICTPVLMLQFKDLRL